MFLEENTSEKLLASVSIPDRIPATDEIFSPGIISNGVIIYFRKILTYLQISILVAICSKSHNTKSKEIEIQTHESFEKSFLQNFHVLQKFEEA